MSALRLSCWTVSLPVARLAYPGGDPPVCMLSAEEDVLGLRDRAMLSVFYGCGLRLQEGASLDISDVLHDKRMLYVRRGRAIKKDMCQWRRNPTGISRSMLSRGDRKLLQQPCAALFIDANKGRQVPKQSLYVRIKALVRKAHITKEVGTHTLRHSIATHLLQSDMPLERIAAFLGHAALDSTQIYTHLINEPQTINDDL